MSQLPPTSPQQIPVRQFQPQYPQVEQFQPQYPQAGYFQPQYPFPPNEQRSRRPWYKKQGIIIGLVCSLILFVMLLSYSITTVLENGQASTPAATVTPSSQLAVASPTAVPTLVPTPVSTLAPTPIPKVQVTPTVVPTATTTPVPTATATPKPTIVNVKVYNSGFSPAIMTISVGSTVIWANDGAIAHTVTDNNKAFDSGNLASGATFQFTFLKRGTYHYVCTYHPFMVGTIIVK